MLKEKTKAEGLLYLTAEGSMKVDLKNPKSAQIVEVATRQVKTAKDVLFKDAKVVERISKSLEQLSRVDTELMSFIDDSSGVGDAKAMVDSIVEQMREGVKYLTKLNSILMGSKDVS